MFTKKGKFYGFSNPNLTFRLFFLNFLATEHSREAQQILYQKLFFMPKKPIQKNRFSIALLFDFMNYFDYFFSTGGLEF